MNSSVVAVPYLCCAVQVRKIWKNGPSPIFSRKGLQRHPTAAVDRAGEHRVPLRISHHDLPERTARRPAVVVVEEVLVRATHAEVLIPEVLGERRESLI